MIAQALAEFWPGHANLLVLISSSGWPPSGAPPPTPAFDYDLRTQRLNLGSE